MSPAHPPLGIIEGFYGRPWSWQDRKATIARLAPAGYGFYLYAPKGDAWLRRRWQEDYPGEMLAALSDFAEACKALGLRFGMGLSPHEIYTDFNSEAKEALGRKLDALDAVGIEDLALLFDDMRGDSPDLAARQAEVVAWAQTRSAATRIFVCPSYYSDDPVLDRVFGHRPENYLEDLSAALDPGIEIFWTGEEVCARQFSPGHLARVSAALGRKPFLWDNYPVNDGQRMSQFLHLRGFTGRPASIAAHLAGHGINPSLQPTLACIPALTLVESYARGEAYEYGAACRRAAETVLGAELGRKVWEDVLNLQEVGLDRLGEREAVLRGRYENVDHPGAREIVAWLNGHYRFSDEQVQTQ